MSAITDEPATLQQALSDPNWHNAMNEEYSVLIKKTRCGTWFLLILQIMLLIAGGYTKSSVRPMAPLTDTKLVWLPKVSNSAMALTMRTLSAQ
jgi:hypothetical protein